MRSAMYRRVSMPVRSLPVPPPSSPSLGVLIASHFTFIGVQWTALAFPVALLVLIFLAFQVVGDGLRDALDPRSR